MKYFSDSLDRLTGGLKNIDTDHSYIHEGAFFTASDIVTIATGAFVYYGFTVPAGSKGRIHYRPGIFITKVDECTIEFFEGSTFTTGTVIPSFNHLRESPKTAGLTVVKSPTVTQEALRIQQTYLPGSTGTGQQRSGSFSTAANEWVLIPGTKYLGKIINGSTAQQKVGVNLQWYEEGY